MNNLCPQERRRSSIGGEGTAGVRGLWTFSSGSLPEFSSSSDDSMWESMSSMPEEDRVDQDRKSSEEEVEPLNRGPLSSYSDEEIEEAVTRSVNSALERARQRRSRERTKESRSLRRSLVEASMISMSQRDLQVSPSSSPLSSPNVGRSNKVKKSKTSRGATA